MDFKTNPAAEKYGQTCYTDTSKSTQNKGGKKYTVSELAATFDCGGKNSQKINSLVTSNVSIFSQYAGSDGVLSTDEYDSLINSKEYEKFIKEYQELAETDEEEETFGANFENGEYQPTYNGTIEEASGKLEAVTSLMPETGVDFLSISNAGDSISEIAKGIYSGLVGELSSEMQGYYSVMDEEYESEDEMNSALDDYTKEIEGKKEEAYKKLELLQSPMKALNELLNVAKEKGLKDSDISSVASTIAETAQSVQSSSLKDNNGELEENGGSFGAEIKTERDAVKKEIEQYENVLKDEGATEEEKTEADNNLSMLNVVYEMYSEMIDAFEE